MDWNAAVLVTNPPWPSGSCQRIGMRVLRATPLVIGGFAGAEKPPQLNADSTVNVFVTAVVKLTRSLPVTLNVREPAVFVFTSAPSAFVPVQDCSETSVHAKS